MKNKFFCKLTLLILLFLPFYGHAFTFSDLSGTVTDIFAGLVSDSEGETAFRSLLIPIGGRPESLGSAFTGLCDDSAYINFNSAASCLQKQTQVSVYHNSWIADSKMETLAATTRFENLGLGAQISCFYLPFTEYNIFGERVNGSYYSETTAALNISYNFLAGYNFKGIAVGGTVKAAFRNMPDFADDDTGAILQYSGLSQSSFGLMADFGVLLQFNFWKKLFYSRDPNVRIGISAQNIGAALTGLGSNKGIHIDDPLPTYFAAGMSVKFLPGVTVTADIKQPVNLFNPGSYQMFSAGAGAVIAFTDNFNLLAGFQLKGASPRISAGAEFEFEHTRLNLNYTLDFTSSFNPINRISLSARVLLGDRGRAEKQKIIDDLYLEGLGYYSNFQFEEAIECWNKILILHKRYDPAILGIRSAQTQINMLNEIRDSMFLDDTAPASQTE